MSNPDRFRRLVQRIANWTDNEVAVVCPKQTRHIARLVMAGADPQYPPFDADTGFQDRTAVAGVELSTTRFGALREAAHHRFMGRCAMPRDTRPTFKLCARSAVERARRAPKPRLP